LNPASTLRGVTTQKTANYGFTAVKTSIALSAAILCIVLGFLYEMGYDKVAGRHVMQRFLSSYFDLDTNFVLGPMPTILYAECGGRRGNFAQVYCSKAAPPCAACFTP
jgi:hypothetical protein